MTTLSLEVRPFLYHSWMLELTRLIPGGTAGNVIASRLSEKPTNKVLVIEAGGR
jgi:GMC oxidoreductase